MKLALVYSFENVKLMKMETSRWYMWEMDSMISSGTQFGWRGEPPKFPFKLTMIRQF